MCAQTRPRFILSSERVFGGMEFEPMLSPREKSPLPENVPKGGSNRRRCGQRAQALPTELFRPRSRFDSRFRSGDFPNRVMPVTYKSALHWLPCQAPGVIGSALELVGSMSVYQSHITQHTRLQPHHSTHQAEPHHSTYQAEPHHSTHQAEPHHSTHQAAATSFNTPGRTT